MNRVSETSGTISRDLIYVQLKFQKVRRENWAEKKHFDDIMVETNQIQKNTNLQIQEKTSPKRIITTETISRHMINKLINFKGKEKILKVAREKE